MGQVALQHTAQTLDAGMVTLLADSVVTRLVLEIEKLSNVSAVDEQWLSSVMEMTLFTDQIETGFGHGRSYALAIIKRKWDSLPFAVRSRFGYDFMDFARTWTGQERSTIDNAVLTANIWFIDKVRPNHTVRRMERDTKGRPILDGQGNIRYTTTEFNPFLVKHSKLLIVNSRAAKGEMTERLWEMLVDPWFTCEDVRLEHAQTQDKHAPPDIYFTVIGPGLYLQHGADTVCLAEALNWEEYETNMLVKDGLDRLMRLLHLKLDEDYIYDMNRSAYASTGHCVQGHHTDPPVCAGLGDSPTESSAGR